MSRPASALSYYSNLAWRAGVPFGCSLGSVAGVLGALMKGWLWGVGIGLTTALLSGALFGISMAAILGTLARRETRGMGPDALEVHQRRAVDVARTKEDVVRLVGEALAELPRAGPVHFDEASSLNTVNVGLSWKSFGEVVSARVEELGPNQCRVHLESRPKIETTLVDYGANATNVNRAVASIRGQYRARLR